MNTVILWSSEADRDRARGATRSSSFTTMGGRITKQRKTKKCEKNLSSTLDRPSATAEHERYKPWADISYRPLAKAHIRILQLCPGQFGTPLYAKLAHALLEDVEDDFEAISYAWGEHVYPQSIHIIGIGMLRITESLHSALEHFRYRTVARSLWTDAICINQSDDRERSSQVAIMGDIYGAAKRVLVWLGLASESDTLAFATLAAFAEWYNKPSAPKTSSYGGSSDAEDPSNAEDGSRADTYSSTWVENSLIAVDHTEREDVSVETDSASMEGTPSEDGSSTSASPRDNNPSMMGFISDHLSKFPNCACCEEKFQIPENLGASSILAVATLGARPWFSRLWVLQEIFVKGDDSYSDFNTYDRVQICCGFHREYWDQFHSFLMHIHLYFGLDGRLSLVSESRSIAQRIEQIAMFFAQRTQVFTTASAMHVQLYCADKLCSDPLDRIFAVRRMLLVEDILELQPNYSLLPCEIYRRFVVACLERSRNGQHGNLATSCIFAIVGTEKSSPTDDLWPSWVPNFNSLTARSSAKLYLYQVAVDNSRVTQFFPNPGRFEWFVDSNELRDLQIKGRRFAELGTVLIESSWPVMLKNSRHQCFSNGEAFQIIEWYSRCKAFAQKYGSGLDLTSYFHGFLFCVQNFKFDSFHCTKSKIYRPIIENSLSKGWNEEEVENILTLFSGITHLNHSELDEDRMLCQLVGEGFEDIAWVPKAAQIGDQFCIFAGEPFPFLVRDRGDGRFRLLGETFVATTSLMQALGGTGEAAKRDFDLERDPTMDWRRDDEYMKCLLESLEWITLR